MALPLSETISAGQAGHIAAHNDIHDMVNRLNGYMINVMDYGATGDGTTDDTSAITAAIAAAPDAVTVTDSGLVGRKTKNAFIFFPVPSQFYRVTAQIDIPVAKNVTMFGPGSASSRIKMDNGAVSYIFRIRTSGAFNESQRMVRIQDLFFHKGGVLIEGDVRRDTELRNLAFYNTPDYAVKTEGISVVNLTMDRLNISECTAGISIGFEQSDLITISRSVFVRNRGVDIYTTTSGLHVNDCDFEVKPDAQMDKPFVHLLEGTAAAGNDVIFHSCRFGNEVNPPRDLVVFGALDGSVDASEFGAVWFDKCFFRGANGGIPTTTQGNTLFVMNNPVKLRVTNCSVWVYDTIIKANFMGNATASANASGIEWHHNDIRTPPVTAFVSAPLYFNESDRDLINRGLLRQDRQRPTENLVARTETLESGANWITTQATVTKNVTGPSGAANSAYTLERTASGTCGVRSVTGSIAGTVATMSIWAKAGTMTDLRFQLITGTNIHLVPRLPHFKLGPEWQRYEMVANGITPGAALTAHFLVGVDGLTTTSGNIQIAYPQVENGAGATPYVSNADTGGTRHNPKQFQSLTLGMNIVGYGTAAPASGQYERGDVVLRSDPSFGGKLGWVCVTSGSPGVWWPWGQIDPAPGGFQEQLKATAALYETVPRNTALSSSATPTTGKMWLQAMYIPAGVTVTSITWRAGATGATTPTNQWFALYDSSRNLLRQTTDDTTTAWSANTGKTLNLTTTFLTTYSGLHYLGVMVAAATPPTMVAMLGSTGINGLAPIIGGMAADTGLTTTAPNPAGAITAASQEAYGYVS